MFDYRDDSGMDAEEYSVGPKHEFVGINDGIKSRIRMIKFLKQWVRVLIRTMPSTPFSCSFALTRTSRCLTRASVSSFRYLTPRGILGNSVDRPNTGVGYELYRISADYQT